MVNLSVEETSGVDHPAHLSEGWVILKQADRKNVAAAIAALVPTTEGDTVSEQTGVIEIDDSLDELAKANERIAELEAQLALVPAIEVDESSDEAILKAAPAAVREMLEKARIETESAKAELQKARDMARDKEFVEKAQAWNHLSLDAQAFGPMLRRLFDLDANLGEIIAKALSAADAQADAGAIFGELGKNAAPVEGDAYARISAMAKSAVQAGEYKTQEQAVAGLVAANPNLYSEYLASRD